MEGLEQWLSIIVLNLGFFRNEFFKKYSAVVDVESRDVSC
jgi:hypothetical protein